MTYTIAAIPTRYSGVNFRSRLEARWAAFFDLCGWAWEYEPFDLEGWAPDFLIRTPFTNVLVEVKPFDIDGDYLDRGASNVFAKAIAHWSRAQVLLLGMSPCRRRQGIGSLLDEPEDANHDWLDVYSYLTVNDSEALWREAGNRVQWLPRS